MDSDHYIASACGHESDRPKNIQTNPNVEVREWEFYDVAESVTYSIHIADFIGLRLKCPRIMIHFIMTLFDGLPLRFTRADLEKFCQEKALVILRRVKD